MILLYDAIYEHSFRVELQNYVTYTLAATVKALYDILLIQLVMTNE